MTLFVACSSSDTIPMETMQSASSVLQNLACEGYDLVTGGTVGGLMQESYHAFHEAGRMITAIVASRYQEDLDSCDCDMSMITENTFDRIKQTLDYADACLFLPGGIGTVAEFLSALEEKRTYDKEIPLILYNEDGSFDPLLDMIEKLYEKGYTSRKTQENYKVVFNQTELFYYLDSINQEKQEVKIKKTR